MVAGAFMLLSSVGHSFAIFDLTDIDVTVEENITFNDTTGHWDYQYTLVNNSKDTCVALCDDTIGGIPADQVSLDSSDPIIEFYVPYFDDYGLTNTFSPTDWTYTTTTDDLFGLGSGAGALVWSTELFNGLYGGDSLSGFGYSSVHGPGKGPFGVDFAFSNSYVGDPGIPASPSAIAAGITPYNPGPVASVPEPTTLLLLLSGIAGLLMSRFKMTKEAREAIA